MEFCGIHLTTILQEAHAISVHDIIFKIMILKLRPHLPEASELKGHNSISKLARVANNSMLCKCQMKVEYLKFHDYMQYMQIRNAWEFLDFEISM